MTSGFSVDGHTDGIDGGETRGVGAPAIALTDVPGVAGELDRAVTIDEHHRLDPVDARHDPPERPADQLLVALAGLLDAVVELDEQRTPQLVERGTELAFLQDRLDLGLPGVDLRRQDSIPEIPGAPRRSRP